MDKRIDTIPLRDAWNSSRKKRANKAVKVIKDYVVRHTKSKIVKVSKSLNEEIWTDSSMNPPRKVKVQIFTDKDSGVSWTELADVVFVKPVTKEEKTKVAEEQKKKAEADIAKKEAEAKKSAEKRKDAAKTTGTVKPEKSASKGVSKTSAVESKDTSKPKEKKAGSKTDNKTLKTSTGKPRKSAAVKKKD